MNSYHFKKEKISVVIPVLNEAKTIGPCLSKLQSQIDRHEIVVVDGGSADNTMDIVRAFSNVKPVCSPRGRSVQMNKGAEVANGDMLLFLHSDTYLPPNGLSLVQACLEKEGFIGGAFCLRFDYPSRFLKLYAHFSRINHIFFTYGDQGLFMAKDTFDDIGGFPNIPIMEDVEIQKRLRSMGRFVKIQDPVVTSARRFLNFGIIKQEIFNISIVLLYHLGVSPFKLAPWYRYPG